LSDFRIENESIVKVATVYNKNPYSINLQIQGVSAGTTRLFITYDGKEYGYTITVAGGESSTTTTQTPITPPETTTTTTPTQPAVDYLGDMDRNSVVNAIDAANILTASAAKGAGKATGLTAEQERDADVNGDGDFDSQDASIILYYGAKAAIDFKGSIREFVAKFL